MEWGRSWVALIVSLLLASLVWILSNLSQTYSGTVSVPVMARCNLEGHQGLSSNTVLVSARCRTQGFRLVREQSRRERKTLVVDFSPADLHRTGPETFCVIGGAINSYVNQFFGEETTVEAFITDTLRFTFPLENHKKVPVEVPMTVHCRSQYMQSGPFHTTPDSVTVYGEDARLESIDKVTTSRLVLSDVHDTRSGILRLNPINGVRLSVPPDTNCRCSRPRRRWCSSALSRWLKIRFRNSVSMWITRTSLRPSTDVAFRVRSAFPPACWNTGFSRRCSTA